MLTCVSEGDLPSPSDTGPSKSVVKTSNEGSVLDLVRTRPIPLKDRTTPSTPSRNPHVDDEQKTKRENYGTQWRLWQSESGWVLGRGEENDVIHGLHWLALAVVYQWAGEYRCARVQNANRSGMNQTEGR